MVESFLVVEKKKKYSQLKTIKTGILILWIGWGCGEEMMD